MTLFSMLTLGLLASTLGSVSEESETRIRHRQLTWDDFVGDAPPRGLATAHIATALVIDEIEIRTEAGETGWISRPAHLAVYAVMFPQRSGAKARGRTPRTLAHEQRHFDLAELQAGLLAGELIDISGTGSTRAASSHNLRANMLAVFEQHKLLLAELNQLYDRETNHGRSQRKQREWNRTISQGFASQQDTGRNVQQ